MIQTEQMGDMGNFRDLLTGLILGMLASLLISLLTGCRSVKYISVPEYHKEFIWKTDTFAKLDSIYQKDSVFVLLKGDTVFQNKITYRDRYHNVYKAKRDTLIREDSVLVPYPVARELSKHEQRLMDIGKCAVVWLICLGLLAVISVCFCWWYKNKAC